MRNRKLVKVEKNHGPAAPIAAVVLLLGFWLFGAVNLWIIIAAVAVYVGVAVRGELKHGSRPGKVVIEDDPLI